MHSCQFLKRNQLTINSSIKAMDWKVITMTCKTQTLKLRCIQENSVLKSSTIHKSMKRNLLSLTTCILKHLNSRERTMIGHPLLSNWLHFKTILCIQLNSSPLSQKSSPIWLMSLKSLQDNLTTSTLVPKEYTVSKAIGETISKCSWSLLISCTKMVLSNWKYKLLSMDLNWNLIRISLGIFSRLRYRWKMPILRKPKNTVFASVLFNNLLEQLSSKLKISTFYQLMWKPLLMAQESMLSDQMETFWLMYFNVLEKLTSHIRSHWKNCPRLRLTP